MPEPTPAQLDELTVSESTTERDQLAAKLAHALAANQRWAETLADVQKRHTEVKAERERLRGECNALATSHGRLHEQLAEVRRIALQGGQDGESVRRELIAYLEASGARPADVRPRDGEPGWLDVTCGGCGSEFGTNFAVAELECPECEARRCPSCHAWFGGDDA